MNWYLVRTAYGTDVLWAGSTGERAMKNAEAALGIRVVSFRPCHTQELPRVA